jgi:acyl-phosphate glycerol 3-phosphate acyltransferase
MTNIAIAIVVGYILGSFPSAYLVSRLKKGIDIREVGSKNMGAMNVLYQVGPVEAVLVTLADLGKGTGAILLVRWLSGTGSDFTIRFSYRTDRRSCRNRTYLSRLP